MVVRCSSLIFIICFFLLSCQTTQKVAIKEGSVTPEQEYARKKIREWEEYMSLLEYGDASIETVLRLSDEYFMAKEVLHEREMEDYELKRQFYQLDKIKSEPEEPLPDYALPVKYFKKLANEYRYGAGADALRYILAYSLYEDGKLNEAVPLYESLLTNFPESDYRMETTFRLAEFYFETGQYGEAIDKYNGILRDLNSGFYEQSLYKLGWAYYKTGEFENSVDSFISILDRRWDGEFKKGGLMEEAASSMTMALNHFKDMGQVINYLKSKGLRDYTPSIVKRLAERISEEGRYAEAVSAYRGFMHLFPDAVDIPFVYEEISRLYEFIDDEENSLKTREELVLLFNPKSGRYRRIYPKGSEPVDKLVHSASIFTAKLYHAKGKEAKDMQILNKAATLYLDLLTYFPESPERNRATLLLAEAYFDAENFPGAAAWYEKAAELYPKGDDRGDAIYSAILTYEILFQQPGDNKGEFLNKIERLLPKFSAAVSDKGRTVGIMERMADMYAELGAFDKARSTFTSLAESGAAEKYYLKIAELHLREGNLDRAEEIYVKLIKDSKNSSIKEKLSTLRLKIAERYLESGELDIAAGKFNQAYLTLPASKAGEEALIKLGYLHVRMGDTESLLKTANRIAGRFPHSDKPVSLLVEGGKNIEKDQPAKAAALYIAAASMTSGQEDADKLTLAAIILFEKNNRYDKSEELLYRYLQSSRLSPEDEAEALYMLAYAQIYNGKKESGYETLRNLLKKNHPAGARVLAKARLLLLQEGIDSYMTIKLAQPFEKTFKKKAALLESLLKEAADIVTYKIPEHLPEIFFKMGLVLGSFKDSIIESERPVDLSAEDLEDYNFLLEERAYPYEEQSVKAYEKALALGIEYKAYDEWVMKSLGMLSNIRPALYRRELGAERSTPVFNHAEAVYMELER